MSDVNGATPPPGYTAMLGDTIGLPGLIASGRLVGSQNPGLPARYGASAGGSLAGGTLTAALTAAQVMSPTAANAGEIPQYIKDPATGSWVPNPAAKDQQLLKQAGQPASAFPSGQVGALSPMPGSSPFPLQPNGMNPTGAAPMPDAGALSPMSSAMDAQASSPVPLPTPRPAMPAPLPAPPQPQAPLSLAPPAPGLTVTAPPPNVYNG